MKTDYTRTVIEHYNETKPKMLRKMFQENKEELKEIIRGKVRRAEELAAHYRKETDLNETEIQEMINNYLAPAEELTEVVQEEMSEEEIDQMMEVLQEE